MEFKAGEPARRSPIELLASVLGGSDEHFAVTGATGWLGAVALDLLYAAYGERASTRVTGYASAAREVVVADGRRVEVHPLGELIEQRPAPTTLIHLAYLTRDKVGVLGVDAYTSQNVAISAIVLDAIAAFRPPRVIVASSGAVHGSSGRLEADLRADPYGTLKHLDELAFRSAVHDVGGVCVIPRIFSVAGRRMTKPSSYALGSMIQMARGGGPILVRAQAPVLRSYCGVDEVVALALWASLRGENTIFETGGTVVEVGDLAHLVAQAHRLDPGVLHRTWDPSAPADRYVGDGRVLETLAELAGMRLRGLPELIRGTSGWLRGGERA